MGLTIGAIYRILKACSDAYPRDKIPLKPASRPQRRCGPLFLPIGDIRAVEHDLIPREWGNGAEVSRREKAIPLAAGPHWLKIRGDYARQDQVQAAASVHLLPRPAGLIRRRLAAPGTRLNHARLHATFASVGSRPADSLATSQRRGAERQFLSV